MRRKNERLQANRLLRQEAERLGKKRYFTGETCSRGHVAERWVSSLACVACTTHNAEQWKGDSTKRKRRWYTKNVERQHRDRIQSVYGITPEQHKKMLEEQRGRCAICGNAQPCGRRLCVDHHHASGAVRGLLCFRCNRALGALRDSPSLLRTAADYLERTGRHDI